MEELQEYSDKEDSNFDLKAEVYKYLVHWKLVLLGCIVGVFIAYMYNRYTIPEFLTLSSMMILKDDQNQMVGELPSGGASILAFDNSTIDNQIETLRSRQLIEEVVKQLDLNISYFNEGQVIAVEAYERSSVVINFLSADSVVNKVDMSLLVSPISSTKYELLSESENFSESFSFGEVVAYNDLEFIISPRENTISNFNTVNIKINPLREVTNDYIDRLSISRKGKAKDILSLSITGEVVEKSQDFLNALMVNFNAEGVSDKRQVAENTAEFIQERLELISEELDSVEGGMAEFKRENRIMDVRNSAGEYMEKSSMAEQEIFQAETQLAVVKSVRQALSSSDPYKLLPSNLGIEEGGISGLINQYNELILRRNAYLKNSTAKNPVVQAITEQLDSLRQNLLDNIEATVDALAIRIEELSQRDRQAEGKFSTFPGLEKGIRTIQRQQQIKEELYLFLLQRREESAISYAATSPVARIIDPAYTITEPVNPKPWFILFLGLVIGLLIPLLIIFIRNFLDTKVHHKGDLNPLIKNIPFLGEIPQVESDENDIIQLNDRSPLAESFRILRTNLAYLVQSRNIDKAEVIFVTSTVKGEGKTFVSFNMARTFASTNKKVLLIGADIRNPKLHKFSNVTVDAKGLSDFLYNHDIGASDIIVKTNEDGIPMDFVFSGSIPPNPAELFMNDRMKTLLAEVEKEYDYVIVDTAPTMIVTDTLLISPLAHTTLYIIRAGHTEKKLMDFPRDLKKQGKLRGLAIVLNDVDYSKFSYGAKYGYSYGYGYGADEEKKTVVGKILGRFK